MEKIAFLFPGQGSQEVGMGRDLFKDDEYFKSLVALGSELSHEDLATLCLKGPDTQLRQPHILQPLLAAVCLGYLRRVSAAGIKADVVLGHSLGEIISLAAAGIVSCEDCIRIAAKRGELMDRTAQKVGGGMMAALFVPLQSVEQVLEELSAADRIVLANDNAPDQLVVSGDNEMLDRFAAIVRERRLGKCMKLAVAGPWHSPYMREARVEFEEWVEHVPFNRPQTPILLNATSRLEEHPATIKRLVTWQLTNPVFWRQSMIELKRLGVDTMLEIGPGRVLSGLARVNGFRTGAKICNVNNLHGLDKAVTELLHPHQANADLPLSSSAMASAHAGVTVSPATGAL